MKNHLKKHSSLIKTVEFIKSSTKLSECPDTQKPEYAFIGRSNVGKSSLINMLTSRKNLAKTSSTPGKTQLINHFLVEENWYLVDLPGYGWAKTSQTNKLEWKKMIENYLIHRPSLANVFVLIDIRHEPQKNDLSFIQWIGKNAIPFSIIFTKSDKLKKQKIASNVTFYQEELKKNWEELPEVFITSAEHKEGGKEVVEYIKKINQSLIGD